MRRAILASELFRRIVREFAIHVFNRTASCSIGRGGCSSSRDHLGIERFRILGDFRRRSLRLRRRLEIAGARRAIAIVSGAPPFAELSDHRRLLPLYRWMIWFASKAIRVVMRALFYAARPIRFAGAMRFVCDAASFELLCRRADADALRDNAPSMSALKVSDVPGAAREPTA